MKATRGSRTSKNGSQVQSPSTIKNKYATLGNSSPKLNNSSTAVLLRMNNFEEESNHSSNDDNVSLSPVRMQLPKEYRKDHLADIKREVENATTKTIKATAE